MSLEVETFGLFVVIMGDGSSYNLDLHRSR